MRLFSMKIKSKHMAPLMIKQEHSVTTEVLQVLGFIAFRQSTRNKWMLSLSGLQHAAKSFSFPKYGDLRTPTGGLIRGLNIKPLNIDVTIANPTFITYSNRGSSREEHVAIKDKEKLKNDKYSQRCQMIDSDFMPMAFEIYGACSEKFEDFLKKMVKAASDANHVPYSVLLNYWRKRFSVTLQTFNARLITQAYLVIFDNGGRNLERDFSSARAFEMLSA